MDIKIPTSKEEMDELRNRFRQEITEDDLDDVVGGNDDRNKSRDGFDSWICPFCNTIVKCRDALDATKHMTKCPNNPYK